MTSPLPNPQPPALPRGGHIHTKRWTLPAPEDLDDEDLNQRLAELAWFDRHECPGDEAIKVPTYPGSHRVFTTRCCPACRFYYLNHLGGYHA